MKEFAELLGAFGKVLLWLGLLIVVIVLFWPVFAPMLALLF